MDFIKEALKNKLAKGLKLKIVVEKDDDLGDNDMDEATEEDSENLLNKKADGLAPDTKKSKKLIGKAVAASEQAEDMEGSGQEESGELGFLEKILAALPGSPNGRDSMTLDERAKLKMREKIDSLKNKA